MFLNRKKYLAAVFTIALTFSFYLISPDAVIKEHQECFMVLAGKKATHNGRVMLARNNDLTGKEVSFVDIIPGKYDTGTVQVEYSNGLSIELPARTYKVLMQRIEKGFEEGDAVAINEFGVAIAGGVALGSDRNQNAKQVFPLAPEGLPGGIRYDILARSKTARECVEMLGEAYSKYGVYYPSGVGIADSNEIWYIECGGGWQWAAIRIPDSCYSVHANGYRIGVIDTTDKDNFLVSCNLLGYCVSNGLWNPDEGPFNFADAFGGGRTDKDGGLEYDRLRVWRAISLLTPSLRLKPDSEIQPIYLTPDKKITEVDLLSLLRDFYAGTDFDRSRLNPLDESIRSIASWRAVHSSLIVITPSQPIENASMLWSGIGSSFITGFTPIPFGVSQIPELYNIAGKESAFNRFLYLARYSSTAWDRITSVQNSFAEIEYDLLEQANALMEKEYVSDIDEEELNLFAKNGAEKILENLIQWLVKE